MEVGVCGENGVFVLNCVVLDYSIVLGCVLGFFYWMEVNSVLGRIKRWGIVIFIIVLVCKWFCMMCWRICLYFFLLLDKIISCKFCFFVNKFKCGKMLVNKSVLFIWIIVFVF